MEGVLSSRPTPIDRMTWQAMTAVFTIFTFLPTSAFAGLDGINWHSEQDYISAMYSYQLARAALARAVGGGEKSILQ